MPNFEGLVFACRLDGEGGATFGGWDVVEQGGSPERPLWIHIDHKSEAGQVWLQQAKTLSEIVTAALISESTRPRSVRRGDGILAAFRGVNLNPGATPDDMVALRLYVEESLLITTRHRRLMAITDVRQDLEGGHGPKDAGAFLCAVIESLLDRMSSSLEAIDERIDAIHDRILGSADARTRADLSVLRSQIIEMRRYLAPQRDAVTRLQAEQLPWISDADRERLREQADRTTRYVEDLESARDRATIAQEELSSRMSEQMNRTMYILALISAVFLPLGLLTGLLGVNVGGMPGAENPHAFWLLCGGMVVLALGMWWFFKRRQLV